jgi:hypothetical protein
MAVINGTGMNASFHILLLTIAGTKVTSDIS